MIDPFRLQRWLYAALFAGLALLIVFVRILPLGGTPGGFPPPDLIVLAGFAWVLRRPGFVPLGLFALIVFTSDMLFLAPPGLGAALAVMGLEFLRARVGFLRGRGFGIEWLTVAAVLAGMMLASRIVLGLFLVPQVGFGLATLGLAINILVYPLVVAVSVYGLGVHRLSPRDTRAEARLA